MYRFYCTIVDCFNNQIIIVHYEWGINLKRIKREKSTKLDLVLGQTHVKQFRALREDKKLSWKIVLWDWTTSGGSTGNLLEYDKLGKEHHYKINKEVEVIRDIRPSV